MYSNSLYILHLVGNHQARCQIVRVKERSTDWISVFRLG